MNTTAPLEITWLIAGQSWRNCGDHPWPRDVLAYMAATKEEAVAKCRRLNPEFQIESVTQSDR